MHPPLFSASQTLSDWPACTLEIGCACKRSVTYPVKLLLERFGDVSFKKVTAALRCQSCSGSPAPVYLCAGSVRTSMNGPSPDWAVELVPPARRD